MTITHINPATLHQSPYFSQGVLAEGTRILQVGGQNGTDAAGAIVDGGVTAQTTQAMRNVLAILEEVGASQENVTRLAVYLVGDADPDAAIAGMAEWGNHPTAITVLRVVGLARSDALVEVEATAVL